MKQHYPFLTFLLILITLISGCRQQATKNYLFDFGNSQAEGYHAVTPQTKYSAELGYGLVTSAERFGPFAQSYVKNSDPVLQNGLRSMDSLGFRVDADPGEYLLLIPVGEGEDPATDIKIYLNDEVLTESITTPWLTLPYRTFSRKIYLKGSAIFTFVSRNNRPVSIHGIELRAVSGAESLELPTLLDQDTTEIQALKREVAGRPQSISNSNLLNDLKKCLKACYYYDIGWWSWAVEETGMSIFPRYHIASDLLRQIIADEDHPLYDKSAYLMARIHYWLYKEQGNEYNREQYEKYFKLLHDKYPEHEVLSMYYGEKIPHENGCRSDDKYAPAWANLQREAICRMQEMTHWWADSVQAENGELGGKFGDDVEILRWWLPVILGADDQKSREAYTRLVNGVWNSGLLERAFSKKVEDVEHSAELFRDTHPAMFLMNYGNPIYVERCLVSMQNFRDVWTGVNDYGHRHFKSCYLSASEVNENPPYAVDVPLNARATLPMLWAAWYNQNRTTINLFSEWGKAWVEDAARGENGKPAGLMPAAVSYKDDKIGGYAPNWYDPGEGLGWEYFDWESLGHIAEMYNQLLGLYAITGAESLLNPMNSTFEFMMDHPKPIEETTPGSAEWASAQLWGKTGEGLDPNGGIMKLFGSARALVGTDRYDQLIKDAGRHYSQYRVTEDETYIQKGLEEILNIIRYNYPLFTTEVKFTDRVYIPNDDLLFGMYTGHIGSGFEFPGLSATWKNTGTDVAVLVGQSNRKELNAQLYNFGGNKQIGIYTWQLEPGKYQMTLKRKEDGSIITSKPIEITERTSYTSFEIISKELVLLNISQTERFKGLTFPRVDLAFTEEDITLTNESNENGTVPLAVTIHNIGNKEAKTVSVSILDTDGNKLVNKQISNLAAPNDLDPKTKTVRFVLAPDWKGKEITISVDAGEPEITLLNNEVQYTLVE